MSKKSIFLTGYSNFLYMLKLKTIWLPVVKFYKSCTYSRIVLGIFQFPVI